MRAGFEIHGLKNHDRTTPDDPEHEEDEEPTTLSNFWVLRDAATTSELILKCRNVAPSHGPTPPTAQ
ncbi:hypothetical protein QR680_003705 [Steinernema hermaphroditum]|uniref:Uncharacterized protein n=1 Tax=Steinernema hermaphroditum TaxID=289476 RepID=A0AA39LSJ1_9BILA|nr:hypothetical protein QR680_003705 [Steinernema hermaphroditum]